MDAAAGYCEQYWLAAAAAPAAAAPAAAAAAHGQCQGKALADIALSANTLSWHLYAELRQLLHTAHCRKIGSW